MKSKKKDSIIKTSKPNNFQNGEPMCVLNEKEKRLIALMLGDKPQTECEEIVQAQMMALKSTGYTIHIPRSKV